MPFNVFVALKSTSAISRKFFGVSSGIALPLPLLAPLCAGPAEDDACAAGPDEDDALPSADGIGEGSAAAAANCCAKLP